jgi:hypothetical protein
MNLSSLGSVGSLATSALDTARSTFRSLADAAVAADGSGPGPATPPAAEPAPAPAAPATRSAAAPAGRRSGTLLDAYA